MKEITTQTEYMAVDESGVIKCRVHKDVLLDLENAKENIEAVKILANGKIVPVFVDITQAKGATREARTYLAGKEIADIQSACAMLVGSPLSQLIGNFFLGFNKPKFPIKLFKDEDDAMEWLKTFL